MSANEKQEGGTHYAGEFQHWDFTMTVLEGRYLEGNVTKYATRWRKKNGAQDLKKAIHYADKMIEMFDARTLEPPSRRRSIIDNAIDIRRFAVANDLWDREKSVCRVASNWAIRADLEYLKTLLLELLRGAAWHEAKRVKEAAEGAGEAGPGYVDQG